MIGPILLGGAAALGYTVRDHLRTPYDPLFELSGRKWGVDSNLLRAIARRESGFKADAVSPLNTNGSRDYGIMQISSTNFAALNLTADTAKIPSTNIDAGARLLASMRKELGEHYTYRGLVSAYNVGTPRVIAHGITNEPYVSAVTYHHKLYQLGRVFA